MYSSVCRHITCQTPLKARNMHSGEVREIMCWDWSTGQTEQVATFTDGDRWNGTNLCGHWELLACEACGEKHPAQEWPGKMDAFLRERKKLA